MGEPSVFRKRSPIPMTMQRVISIAGGILIVGGLALLGFVAYSSLRAAGGSTPAWTATQKKTGGEIARRYSGSQRVAIPQRLTRQSIPAAGQEAATRMVIPAIAVDAPVVQTAPVDGVWNVADWAVGHLTTTPNPGAPGNAAYSAHDDIKGEVFKRLGELKPGNTISLYTQHAVYVYTVTNQLVVDPSDISVLNPTKSSTITLISCTPYWIDTQRLIIHAVLKSVASI